MFAFHRPKVYRSTAGCCICKAKSSSSRFTDSKKYELDFIECFQLATPRQGEICNACVLLVKRWKKLPVGSDRNWRHVVDARAGPGMKSMTKCKSKHKKQMENVIGGGGGGGGGGGVKPRRKKHFVRELSPTLSDGEVNNDVDMVDFLSENGTSGGSSRTNSPGGSDCEDNITVSSTSRRHKSAAKRRENLSMVSEFIDMDYWKKIKTCCGTVFEGPNGEILVDMCLMKPCEARLAACKSPLAVVTTAPTTTTTTTETSPTKSDIDSSSDSGYDESSNPAYATDPNKHPISVMPSSSPLDPVN